MGGNGGRGGNGGNGGNNGNDGFLFSSSSISVVGCLR